MKRLTVKRKFLWIWNLWDEKEGKPIFSGTYNNCVRVQDAYVKGYCHGWNEYDITNGGKRPSKKTSKQ